MHVLLWFVLLWLEICEIVVYLYYAFSKQQWVTGFRIPSSAGIYILVHFGVVYDDEYDTHWSQCVPTHEGASTEIKQKITSKEKLTREKCIDFK